MNATPQTSPLPVVDRIARHIGDPVTRLRFLQMAAPSAVFRRSGRLNWLVLVALCTIVAAVLFGGALLWKAFAAAPARPEVRLPLPDSHLPAAPPGLAEVWQVDNTDGAEIYSNGLRIDSRYAVSTEPRVYLAFPASGAESSTGVRRQDPAGIVFHSCRERIAS